MRRTFDGLSLVIPVYNEEDGLEELHRRLSAMAAELDLPVEIVFVDDGSKDASVAIIRRLREGDARIRLVQLSRNFGHQIAVTAGLDFAAGQAAVVMDADLQDPPELVPKMVAMWRAGYDVVYATRQRRDHEPALMTAARRAFYRFLHSIGEIEIPVDSGDFRLIGRRALDALGGMREYNRYVRGLSTWVGFKQGAIAYDRPARHAGESKYSLWKLAKLALSGITGFSRWPLQMLGHVGLFMSVASFLAAVFVVVWKLFNPEIIEGWASLVIFVCFLSGLQLLALGVLADYVGRIYEEVKNRPIYVVGDLLGFDDSRPPAGRMLISLPDQSKTL